MIPLRAAARAPASIGNIGVGFDILGQAFAAAHDVVVAEREEAPGVRLGRVSGLVDALPDAVESNTALAAAAALLHDAGQPFGVRLSIDKGVPLSAWLGCSAASAVAAVAAVNALLPVPYATADLLPFALEGERVASDPPPWDNVMASLLGGIVLCAREAPPLVQRLPAPAGVVAVLFHPDRKTETRLARSILSPEVSMATAVEHGRRVAAFVAGCATSDVELLRAGLEDVLVEPQRAHLLPALPPVKAAALSAGAIGCSFSGSGPSVFAWALAKDADAVEQAMADAFHRAGVVARAYRAPVHSEGVSLLPIEDALSA
jgi:homoserine kinase